MKQKIFLLTSVLISFLAISSFSLAAGDEWKRNLEQGLRSYSAALEQEQFGEATASTSSFNKALSELKKAVQYYKEDPNRTSALAKPEIYYLLGRIEFKNGNLDKATDMFTHAQQRGREQAFFDTDSFIPRLIPIFVESALVETLLQQKKEIDIKSLIKIISMYTEVLLSNKLREKKGAIEIFSNLLESLQSVKESMTYVSTPSDGELLSHYWLKAEAKWALGHFIYKDTLDADSALRYFLESIDHTLSASPLANLIGAPMVLKTQYALSSKHKFIGEFIYKNIIQPAKKEDRSIRDIERATKHLQKAFLLLDGIHEVEPMDVKVTDAAEFKVDLSRQQIDIAETLLEIEMLSESQNLLNGEFYERTVGFMAELLEVHTKDLDVFKKNIARLELEKEGDLKESKQKFNRFKESQLEKAIFDIYEARAEFYKKIGKDEDAMRGYTWLIEFYPQFNRAYYKRGSEFLEQAEALDKQNEPEKAINMYKRALQDLSQTLLLTPPLDLNTKIYFSIGKAKMAIGKILLKRADAESDKFLADAIKNFTKSIALDAKNKSEIYLKRSDSYLQMVYSAALIPLLKSDEAYIDGLLTKALADIDKYIDLNKLAYIGYLKRGVILSYLGLVSKAKKDQKKRAKNIKIMSVYFDQASVSLKAAAALAPHPNQIQPVLSLYKLMHDEYKEAYEINKQKLLLKKADEMLKIRQSILNNLDRPEDLLSKVQKVIKDAGLEDKQKPASVKDKIGDCLIQFDSNPKKK